MGLSAIAATARDCNAAVRDAAKAFANVMTSDIADALRDPADKPDGADHFHRVIYERPFRVIVMWRAAVT